MHHFGRLGILVARHLRPKVMTMSALGSQVCAKTDEIPLCGPICEETEILFKIKKAYVEREGRK